MKKIYRYMLPMLALTTMLTACSDDDDWSPGAEVAANCQQVHFASKNSSSSLFFQDDIDAGNRSATLTVVRNTTHGALKMPITVVSKSEGVTIPDSLSFADGDSTTTITITAPDTAKMGDSYSYDLRLTGDNVDPYSVQEGSNIFSGTLSFPTPKTATCWVTGDNDFNNFKQDIYDLGGGKFYISDLMHSGVRLSIVSDADGNLTFSTPDLNDSAFTTSWGYEEIDFNNPNATSTDDAYYVFYPLGKDVEPAIEYLAIWNAPGYTKYFKDYKQIQLCLIAWYKTGDADYSYWGYLSMRLDE